MLSQNLKPRSIKTSYFKLFWKRIKALAICTVHKKITNYKLLFNQRRTQGLAIFAALEKMFGNTCLKKQITTNHYFLTMELWSKSGPIPKKNKFKQNRILFFKYIFPKQTNPQKRDSNLIKKFDQVWSNLIKCDQIWSNLDFDHTWSDFVRCGFPCILVVFIQIFCCLFSTTRNEGLDKHQL